MTVVSMESDRADLESLMLSGSVSQVGRRTLQPPSLDVSRDGMQDVSQHPGANVAPFS